jgi:hypothetical protein
LAVFYQQFGHCVLPDVQVGLVLQYATPGPDEFGPVTLGARAPHGGAFGTVKYAELYGCAVSDKSHVSAQSVYLSDNLAFSYTTNGWIAAHLGNLVHVHGYQTGLGTHLSGSGGGFTTCMPRAYNYHIILKVHTNYKFTANSWNG